MWKVLALDRETPILIQLILAEAFGAGRIGYRLSLSYPGFSGLVPGAGRYPRVLRFGSAALAY